MKKIAVLSIVVALFSCCKQSPVPSVQAKAPLESITLYGDTTSPSANDTVLIRQGSVLKIVPNPVYCMLPPEGPPGGISASINFSQSGGNPIFISAAGQPSIININLSTYKTDTIYNLHYTPGKAPHWYPGTWSIAH